MRIKLFVLCMALLLGIASQVFAGPFSGVGGDADYFPKNGPIISAFIVPLLNLENVSSSTTFGLEGVVGWRDLSFSLKYGKQGASDFMGLSLRKKVIGEETMPFTCTLLYDVDGIAAGVSSANGSYIGAIFSKKIDNLSPYIALLSTTYYTRTDMGVGPITYKYINGYGLAGGARYDLDENWSVRSEIDYNALSTSVPWPNSITSANVYWSYRR